MSVEINVAQAHFWDITAVAALDKVVQRYRKHEVPVQVLGLNAASSVLIDRLDAKPA
jgi:SulP family sulfate permease